MFLTELSCKPFNRDHFVCVPSQWETTLHCSAVSHCWAGSIHKMIPASINVESHSDQDLPWDYILQVLKTMTLISQHSISCIWWHSVMETLLALALCEGSPPVIGGSPHKGPVMQSFDVALVLGLNKLLDKQSSCWWCHDTHVTSLQCFRESVSISWWSGTSRKA